MLCRVVFVKVSLCAVGYNFMVSFDYFSCCVSSCQSPKEDDMLLYSLFIFAKWLKLSHPESLWDEDFNRRAAAEYTSRRLKQAIEKWLLNNV